MKLAVLGGGSWGTALAAHFARAGHDARLWLRDQNLATVIGQRHENPRYLPGLALPPALQATADLARALDGAEMVTVALPSTACREGYRRLAAQAEPGALLISATKGLDTTTLQRMSQIAREEAAAHPVAVVSGPSFAAEVMAGQPTAVVVASEDVAVAERVQRALSTSRLRAYSSEDVAGVELAGALKNVIAIAAGILDGLGLGHNTLAALITRGLAEIARLSVACGARADTMAGLAGLGDLVLTCTGVLSRNRHVGQALGRGLTLEQALAETGMVAEGVRTTPAACALAARHAVEMPIAAQMKAVLQDGKPPREALEELMLRSLKRE
jgi:glycerol-3-phosphate dehydrogenase (NAD(P)+)